MVWFKVRVRVLGLGLELGLGLGLSVQVLGHLPVAVLDFITGVARRASIELLVESDTFIRAFLTSSSREG